MKDQLGSVRSYPAAGVNCCPNAPVREGNEIIYPVYVGVSSAAEHCPTAWKAESISQYNNPILDRLIVTEVPVGNVIIPGKVSALRPCEGPPVVGRSGYETPEESVFGGAVSFPVDHRRPLKLQRPSWVMTRGIFHVLHVARRELAIFT